MRSKLDQWRLPALRPGWFLATLALCLAGCQKQEIHAYKVPKETPAPAAQQANPHASMMGNMAAAAPALRYDAPSGWKEQPAGGMRAARFTVPGQHGQDSDVSVLALPGMRAAKTEIVNLWRQQIRLPAAKEEELAGLAQKVAIGPEEGELYDMASAEPLLNDKFKLRILVAMLKQGEQTWFFKMTGEDQSVQEQKPAFLKFLKTVTFAEAPPTATASAGTSPETPGGEAPASAAEPAAKPQWSVPANWKEVPPTRMLVAKFSVPGKAGGNADVTVSVFPGDVGGVPANVNRWRQQIGLPPAAPAEIDKLTTPLDVADAKGILVDMSGQDPNGIRLLGIIVPQSNRTWFYKLVGDKQVAEQEKAAFVKFAQTAKLPNGP